MYKTYKEFYKTENNKKVKYVSLTFIDYEDEFEEITITVPFDTFYSNLEDCIWNDIVKRGGLVNKHTVIWFTGFFYEGDLFEIYEEQLFEELKEFINDERIRLRESEE